MNYNLAKTDYSAWYDEDDLRRDINWYVDWDQQIKEGKFTSIDSWTEEGLPDKQMVPVVEFFREKGIVTLESCSGHITPEGYTQSGYISLLEYTCKILPKTPSIRETYPFSISLYLVPSPPSYTIRWWNPIQFDYIYILKDIVQPRDY